MGKTTLALNFILNAATILKKRYEAGLEKTLGSVGMFSLEMPTVQLATKLISHESNIPTKNMLSGSINETEYNEVMQASDIIRELPIYIDDTAALSISAIRNRAKKLKRKHNLKLLLLDYLQLILPSKRNDNRVLEISEITQSLKALAKELSIPVIALSQLSRAVESRSDKIPILSDLRESGSIEQDADIVMFIYRESYYISNRPTNEKSFEEWKSKSESVMNIADLIIAKHRNGPIGTVKLFFDPEFSKFGNLYPQH